jgi:hypothetical protein
MEKTIEDFRKELLQEQIYTAKHCAEEVVKQEVEMDKEFNIRQLEAYYKIEAELLYYKQVAKILAEKAGVTI